MKSIKILCLLIVITFNVVSANNYDQYLNRLIDDGKLLYNEHIKDNPENELEIRKLYESYNEPNLKEDINYLNGNDDEQWNNLLNPIEEFKYVPEILLDSQDRSSNDINNNNLDKWEFSPNQHLSEPELTARRNEVAFQNQLWGKHKVSGGSSEIGQWLDYALQGAGAQDSEDNETNSLIELSNELDLTDNSNAKVDNLPAYCDPPNPCPLLYDKIDNLPTPCDRDIEDTFEFNRHWILNKMVQGECTCDTEHMNKCPLNSDVITPSKSSYVTNDKNFWKNPYLRGQKRKRLVAKKRVKRSRHLYHYNPYLIGMAHKTAVKKAGPYKPMDESVMRN